MKHSQFTIEFKLDLDRASSFLPITFHFDKWNIDEGREYEERKEKVKGEKVNRILSSRRPEFWT